MMNSTVDAKNAQHLMNLIATRNGSDPNFALLLGAGASVTSGVKTAEEMIWDWRQLLYRQAETPDSFRGWLDQQDWYAKEDEYSLLFESVFDQPAQRRIYVEESVKDAKPGLGYIYLVDLIARRYFNIVFTTNFDDLLNEACYLYTDSVRPIVAAHDSAVQSVRIASTRPKIVKLHGDFLYDNIKNTLSELETLEENTKRKLAQFAKEFGLVVVGYSGRDRSVMDNIDLLLRDQETFPHGIYWCIRRDSPISARLNNLLNKERVYPIVIDGFDQFAAELHRWAKIPPPRAITSPLDIAKDRARRCLTFFNTEGPLRSHPVIGPHIRQLTENADALTIVLPLAGRAALLVEAGELVEAINLLQMAHEENPEDDGIAYLYANTLADAERFDDLAAVIPTLPLDAAQRSYFLLRAGQDQEVLALASQVMSTPSSVSAMSRPELSIVLINGAIAMKRQDNHKNMCAVLDFLEVFGYDEDVRIRIGITALRGLKDDMMALLKEHPQNFFCQRTSGVPGLRRLSR